MNENEIWNDFKEVLKESGGEFFLKARDGISFIRRCEGEGLAVIGIEGFSLEDGNLIPRLDLIADWSTMKRTSWEEFRTDCNDESIGFLRKHMEPELAFSFVTLQREMWNA